ncbi:glutathione transferase omega-1 [Cryphonectria parasitica EP155]|uniref:Glutathione transferase omega-1 n=1 Tax=Cryphonectria parasitica (strain ATCC 38755 / EP155) TaxID=660469 RepID=A0A9P4Y2Z1_CRYP1|nr:glutathione transferase omega-1 [Cryphonectria parasitica EP155]KAF3765402.1 glutathione transferase omega-1 [Cryphonectria parasitica EP155]
MSIPDENLHPVATGRAAQVVKDHEHAQADHVLYSGWFCPFVQRAWITLEEKKIPYRYQEINPYKKEPSFLKLNPRGLVPALGVPTPDGPQSLIESGIICEYLDETFPQNPPFLLPREDPFRKAKLKISIDYVTSRIIPAFHRFLQHTPEKPYTLDEARKEFLHTLVTWIRDADPTGPFFAGEEFSLPDVVLAPWAVRLWVFDYFKEGGLGIPASGEGGEDEELWERWRVWSRAVSERESVQATTSDREHYLPIYERYATDKAMSELAKATRAGRGVP